MPATAIIIGGGPAGLTAAHELLRRTDVRPVILEADDILGGISRTVSHNGNRIDIGGHRFFSKSKRVMDWWLDVLPMEHCEGAHLAYQGRRGHLPATPGPSPEDTDRVMLVRGRKSRIYHGGAFFDYPLSLSPQTLAKLGIRRSLRIGLSYSRASLRPIPEEKSLEDFLINRFGRELYRTFFKDYTEKVWGVPCTEISAEWGAQRIKGLSLRRALAHFLTNAIPTARNDIAQSDVETSLIEQFLYPKLGPGQLWEVVGERIVAGGGVIHMRHRVVGLERDAHRITAVIAQDAQGDTHRFSGEHVFSTMPVRALCRALSPAPPPAVREVAAGLLYRDFITVGLLVDRLKLGRLDDNWIYIQEPGVQVGRMQVFNNWSPWMVADRSKTWIGLEYFCNDTDPLWAMSEADLIALGIEESQRIGILDPSAVRDGVVIKMPRTYPAYFGTYDRFHEIRAFLDGIENLYPIGRNGMHRYNNQDHSMLTAMMAVDGIAAGVRDMEALWSVNTEAEYHEEK
jgi:protoporphyrinogen oxidase